MAGTKAINPANISVVTKPANPPGVAYRASIVLFFLFGLMVSIQPIQAQNYRISTYPDLWYNDVDGIRAGLRFLGEVEGTFKDGPHRLDAGVWVASKFPDNPVSYYFSFTEPISAISDFGSEGNIQLISSIRTGYSIHQLRFNKRWQQEFDELNYVEISPYFSQEKIFDASYRGFPTNEALSQIAVSTNPNFDAIWDDEWQSILGLNIILSRNQDFGQLYVYGDFKTNLSSDSEEFTVGSLEVRQRLDLSERFKARIRGFAGVGSDNLPFEHRYFLSTNSIRSYYHTGISRSPGIIPSGWIENGSVSFGGGANLRGYASQDGNMLEQFSENPTTSFFSFFQSVWGVNIELDYPNPIDQLIKENAIISDLAAFKSYIFYDVGSGTKSFTRAAFPNSVDLLEEFVYENEILADAGLGFQFSVNIPDYLGKDRGIFIRYDIPLWLSEPSNNESNLRFRNVIGIGAIFNF